VETVRRGECELGGVIKHEPGKLASTLAVIHYRSERAEIFELPDVIHAELGPAPPLAAAAAAVAGAGAVGKEEGGGAMGSLHMTS